MAGTSSFFPRAHSSRSRDWRPGTSTRQLRRSNPSVRPLVMRGGPFVVAVALASAAPHSALAQTRRALLPIEFERSAEFAWLRKPVQASRLLDDMTRPESWRFTGTGAVAFPTEPRLNGMRVLRVDMQMFRDAPAPTRSRLSSVNLRRAFDGEDWRAYNRLSLWIKPEVRGFPMLPLAIVLRNDGVEKVPDRYGREGTHYVTLENNKWTNVVWEIEPLARDRVTAIEIGYWVNKMLAMPGDTVAFEIGRIELQHVTPDNHTGWSVAPRKVAYSHTGYLPQSRKTAIISDTSVTDFGVFKYRPDYVSDQLPRQPVRVVQSRIGSHLELDFSQLKSPGDYQIVVGGREPRDRVVRF